MHNESANKIFNAFINMGRLYQLVNCFIEAAGCICSRNIENPFFFQITIGSKHQIIVLT